MAEPQYDVPEDYKSGLKDVLKEAKEIYEKQKGLGYQTYTGDQIAGFSPDELAAMQGIAGLVGTGQQYFAPAAALTLGQTQRFDPTTAAQYMSPYQQAVVDVEKREAIRQSQVPMQNIAAKAAQAGSFGGSRQAILEAERQRNLQQQLGDIQTRGSQAAYETGLRAFEAQKERERAAASGLSALGQAAPRQAMTELTALAGIGEAQRGMTQAGLDIARSEFEAQKQFPYDTLAQYQSTLYGYPYQSTSRFNPYQAPSKPSSMQNLAGVLGAVGKIAGPSGFGFFNSGGRVAFKSQGGLSGMIKQLAEGSTVGSEMTADDTGSVNKQLLTTLLGLQTGLTDYNTAMQEALDARKKLAEEKKEAIEKQTSGINYVSDLLLGFAAADPEAGFGVQAASAAEYASGEKETAQDEIRQIEEELASGKLTQAEAALKMKQLQATTLSDIKDALGGKEIEPSVFNALRKQAQTLLDPNDIVLDGEGNLVGFKSPETKKAYNNLLIKMLNKYSETNDFASAIGMFGGDVDTSSDTPADPAQAEVDNALSNKLESLGLGIGTS